MLRFGIGFRTLHGNGDSLRGFYSIGPQEHKEEGEEDED